MSWQTLSIPSILRIPLPNTDGPLEVRPVGTVVSKGESLLLRIPQGLGAPLTPCDCRITRVDPHSIELSTLPDTAAISSIPSPPPGMIPSALPEWIDRIRLAGIQAYRICSPDLLAQLHQAMRRPIDTVLCNLLDTDSLVNQRLLLDFPTEILAGIQLIGLIVGARQIDAVVDAGISSTAIGLLNPLARQAGVRIICLANHYPQSDPTLLLYEVLGRKLRPGRLPTEQGVIVLDGAVALAIGQLVLHTRPMLTIPLAVLDHTMERFHFIIAPIGIAIADVLTQLNIMPTGLQVLVGDLLRQNRPTRDSTLYSGEISLHVRAILPADNPDPCVRCGWCVDACPTRIHPAGLLDAAQRLDSEMADRFGMDACIECGICTHVCPSRLPVMEGIRILKQSLNR